MDAFLEDPVEGKNIQAALKYFTAEDLAHAFVDHCRKYKKDYEELAEALRRNGEADLSDFYGEEVVRTNQKLFNGVIALYEYRHNPKE